MSGRIRPSARKKTLNNVMASSLSVTDKKCIEEVFEKFEYQKDKIEALISGQETLQKSLAKKIAESENQSQNFKILYSDCRTLQQSFDNLKGLYEAEKAKVEKAKEKCLGFAKELQAAKTEIEVLKERDETAEKIIREQGGTILRLKDEIDGYSEKTKTYENVIKNTFLEKAGCNINPLAEIKAEAIKEFAERLKEQMKDLTRWQAGIHTYYVIGTEFIDNLVKEMVGDAE